MIRPTLSNKLDKETFLDYYYLKEELKAFCKDNSLPTVGGKKELTERIAYYLETGNILNNKKIIKKEKVKEISLDSLIEENIVFSTMHRQFFIEHLGKGFSFNVLFQNWLKNNSGKTYEEAIKAYKELKKVKNKTIDKQFEYNTYIRDFFNDNKEKSLNEAIKCWKYKKQLKGHNKYEQSDLDVLK